MKFLYGIALMGFSMLAMNKVQAEQLIQEEDLTRLDDEVTDLMKISIDKKGAEKLLADQK